MLSKWDETSVVPVLHPKCQSITSTRFPLKPIRADGWEAVDINDKKSYQATVPGSEIVSMPFTPLTGGSPAEVCSDD